VGCTFIFPLILRSSTSINLQENVYNSKTDTIGKFRYLIVTVEQLFKDASGHFSRLGRTIRNKKYQKHIIRINVDEAHHIRTAGEALYNIKAFRPAWGQLDEFKVLLPRKVRWHAYSATFPKHIMELVIQKIMNPGFTFIHTTSNRPNTTYATHQLVNTVENLRNYECFLTHPFNLATHWQPHVLIFVDDKDLISKIAKHLETCLPEPLQGKKIIRHYHSGMSERYLTQAHEAFTSDEGNCRILVATSGQSVVSASPLCTRVFNNIF
jgi:superfamily II DNA helicase RecQ